MMKNKSDERLSRGVSIALSMYMQIHISLFSFFHGELMFSVDRQDENFMRKKHFFYHQE